MANPIRPLPTYAELLELPSDVRAEILDGEIVVAPAIR